MPPIDWTASAVAAVSAFVLGGLWYSPALFARAWQRETGLSDEQLDAAPKGRIFGLAFVASFVAAVVFSMFVGPDPAPGYALGAGLAVGTAWVASSFAINYLFELKSAKLWAINGGYHVAQFSLYGLVCGLI